MEILVEFRTEENVLVAVVLLSRGEIGKVISSALEVVLGLWVGILLAYGLDEVVAAALFRELYVH